MYVYTIPSTNMILVVGHYHADFQQLTPHTSVPQAITKAIKRIQHAHPDCYTRTPSLDTLTDCPKSPLSDIPRPTDPELTRKPPKPQ